MYYYQRSAQESWKTLHWNSSRGLQNSNYIKSSGTVCVQLH